MIKEKLFVGLLFFGGVCFAQIPQIRVPQPHSMGTYSNQYSGNPHVGIPTTPTVPSLPSSHSIQTDMYKQDMEHVNNMRNPHQVLNEHIQPYLRRQQANNLIHNGFPSRKDAPGTEFFFSAFEELNQMLTGAIPISLSKAVFLIENAWYGGTEQYTDFEAQINERVQLCHWRLKELGINPNDNMAKNMVIYSLLTDTLAIKQPGTEETITHYPLNYNVDDYMSIKDQTSHFVTTLMKTNYGQCHSMPLLYLLMAEKMGADAHLALAPHHSFIKIKDENNIWHNLELTTGYIMNDYFYMNHSYIKSEAIRNNLYLTPLSQKEVVATMVSNLAKYFLTKYGYDPFIIQCADIAIEHFPNNVDAYILKADYQTRLTFAIIDLLQAPGQAALKEMSPEAYEHYEYMHRLYQQIDDMGYEDTPPELYEKWLNHMSYRKESEKNNPSSTLRTEIKYKK